MNKEKICIICGKLYRKGQYSDKDWEKSKFCSKLCHRNYQRTQPPWNKGIKTGSNPEHSKRMIGRKASDNTKKKMSETRKGLKRLPFSEEWRKKIGDAKRGKKDKVETIEKRRQANLLTYKNGRIAHFKGMFGEKSYNWKGGITPDNKKIRNSLEYKEWRKSVFERDDYTCKLCGIRGCYLEADHIKSFSQFPELRLELSNGRTLCKPCHKTTDNYKGKSKKLLTA